MILDVDTDQRSQVTNTRRSTQEGAQLMRLTGELVCAHQVSCNAQRTAEPTTTTKKSKQIVCKKNAW